MILRHGSNASETKSHQQTKTSKTQTHTMNNKPFTMPAYILCDHLKHVTFEYPNLDDLLSAYMRLKEMEVEPVLSTYHSAKTAFYYLGPNGTCVELVAANFSYWERSGKYPMGAFVDADKMIAARLAG